MGSQKVQHNLATKLQLQIPKENRNSMPIPFLKRPDTILKAAAPCREDGMQLSPLLFLPCSSFFFKPIAASSLS